MYPRLKFQLNIKLDIGVAVEFLNLKGGGIDFGKRIVDLYPELEKAEKASQEIKEKIISNFTKDFYRKNRLEIENKLTNIEREWKEIEKEFFADVKKIFGSYPWPNGDYICFLSVYDCNPRFLENKTFQVYYKHQAGTKSVIAHEMLHFIFYDYFENKEKTLYSSLDGEQLWLWSEAFNDIVLSTPEFKKICKKELGSYPEAKSLANNIRARLLNKKINMSNFLQNAQKSKKSRQ